jgi:protein-S-isoprenylcysteine O-methyltransferase Ste14
MLVHMLWARGLIFTALVPTVAGLLVPSVIDRHAQPRGGIWDLGWLMLAAGALSYALCLIGFLAAGGTPAIFFTRRLRFLIGQEPSSLVSSGLYYFSRNPMYLAVLMVIFGQAVLFKSPLLAAYGCAAFLFFHVIVVFVEEPHLRAARGPTYELYCRTVPRWLGLPTRHRDTQLS